MYYIESDGNTADINTIEIVKKQYQECAAEILRLWQSVSGTKGYTQISSKAMFFLEGVVEARAQVAGMREYADFLQEKHTAIMAFQTFETLVDQHTRTIKERASAMAQQDPVYEFISVCAANVQMHVTRILK